MLQRANRLKKKVDFDTVYKHGRFVGGAFVTAKIWQVAPDQFPKRLYRSDDLKIAFVVSKKVHKSAVQRNRVKRRMREIVRLMIKSGQLHHGFMVVLMAKPEMLDALYGDIQKDIAQVFKRGKLFVKYV